MGFFFAIALSTHYIHKKIRNPTAMLLTSPLGKLEHLAENHEEIELIFLGDSRTYIGMDPEIATDITNLQSFNYASMAHWFPTQYPQFKKMIPFLKGKKVVWTIGAINFSALDIENPDVNENFPLSAGEFFEYLQMGFGIEVLVDNLFRSFLPKHSLFFIKEDSFQQRFLNLINTHLFNASRESSGNQTNLKKESTIEHTFQIADETYTNIITKNLEDGLNKDDVLLSLARDNGQLAYIEIEPEYLRSRQQEWALNLGHNKGPVATREMELLYEKILHLFAQAEIDLTIVEYRDAPYQTSSVNLRTKHREFLDSYAQMARDAGFNYLIPDMSELQDNHYFDYNHLNHEGSKLYSTILAHLLKETF